MDATHSNAYRVWQQIGSPAQPSAEQVKNWRRQGSWSRRERTIRLQRQKGRRRIALGVPRQGVVLVRLLERWSVRRAPSSLLLVAKRMQQANTATMTGTTRTGK